MELEIATAKVSPTDTEVSFFHRVKRVNPSSSTSVRQYFCDARSGIYEKEVNEVRALVQTPSNTKEARNELKRRVQ